MMRQEKRSGEEWIGRGNESEKEERSKSTQKTNTR